MRNWGEQLSGPGSLKAEVEEVPDNLDVTVEQEREYRMRPVVYKKYGKGWVRGVFGCGCGSGKKTKRACVAGLIVCYE